MSIDFVLVVLALVFAIVSLFDKRYPWLTVAVIFIAASLLI